MYAYEYQYYVHMSNPEKKKTILQQRITKPRRGKQ